MEFSDGDDEKGKQTHFALPSCSSKELWPTFSGWQAPPLYTTYVSSDLSINFELTSLALGSACEGVAVRG